jgi:hypothetical protein|nr:DUF1203 domain-containing protein [Caldimonas sp.]
MHPWRLSGLDPAPFESLFDLTDDALHRLGAVRRCADSVPGFPCRVSLEDAPVGSELLLVPYEHHPARSPYRASGPIFVRRGATHRELDVGEVPQAVLRRLISLRAYDADAMMVDATVCEGPDVAAALDGFFASGAVDYVHLHFAKRGCFSCAARRVD